MSVQYIENDDNVIIRYVDTFNEIYEQTFYLYDDILRVLCRGSKKDFMEMMKESDIFERGDYVKLKRRHPRVSLKLYKNRIERNNG